MSAPNLTNKEVPVMSGIKGLVGKKMPKEVKFMDEKITIYKLKFSEIIEIQEMVRESENSDKEGTSSEEDMGIDVLRKVIRSSVEGGAELEDADFQEFPMDELTKLSNEIMKHSGVDSDKAGK